MVNIWLILGEHIYVEMGAADGNTGTLNFNFATTSSTTRIFEMKATQIPCASSQRPPEGCLQVSLNFRLWYM